MARESTVHQRRFLRGFGKQLVAEAKKGLKGRGSGALAGSLKAKGVYKTKTLSLSLVGAKHNEFINQGVSGRFKTQTYKDEKGNKKNSSFRFKKEVVNLGAMRKFISRNNIKGRDELGRFISTKALSYLIGRSVASKGIKSSSHISKAWLKLRKTYIKGLKQALAKDIQADIKRQQKNNKK
tara:strand:- start:81 stop:623 length:543 start_codon:yes stop_codon:yes gene_type:complete